jgi:ATP-binding cassette subfamily C exporter for protease/lipase
MLLLAVVGIYLVMEALDLVRAHILHRAAENIDATLRSRLFDLVFLINLRRPGSASTHVFSDLKTLREFIPSPPVVSAMDIPAAIVFLVLLFFIGPWLGVAALFGACIQLGVAWSTERKTMPLLTEATKASIGAQGFASSTMRNAQVIEAMGMVGDIHRRWSQRQRKFLALQTDASDAGGVNAVIAKVVQQMQGSILLGGAAWLALHHELVGGAGMMIAASIIGARALQPLTQLVAQWRVVVNGRDAYNRLDALFSGGTPPEPGMPLPAPKGVLTVEQVVAGPPSGGIPILKGASFAARPGEVVAVVGPSASGKTSLARLLVGIWPAGSGKVRLDGVDVFSWNKAELGPHMGYLPQAVELFDGTVAENIARFGTVDMDKVRRAAQQIDMEQTIEALPQGFDTRIGDDGAVLSGGQRQRVALARAIYGDPQFLVLDEPNASLDEAGEQALMNLLMSLKARGATVVAITHRTTLLPAADKLVVLHDGQVALFGPRDEVLANLKKANEQARAKVEARPAAPALAGAAR